MVHKKVRKGEGEPGNEAISIIAKCISSTAFYVMNHLGGGAVLQSQIMIPPSSKAWG